MEQMADRLASMDIAVGLDCKAMSDHTEEAKAKILEAAEKAKSTGQTAVDVVDKGIDVVSSVEEAVEHASIALKAGKAVQQWLSQSLGQFKIIILNLQIVSTFVENFNVDWPEEFISWSEAMQVVNLGVFDVASLQCWRPSTDFYSKLVFQVTTPISFAGCVFVVMKARTWTCSSTSTADQMSPRRLIEIESQHVFIFLVLLFVVYAGVSSTLMKLFRCTEIDGTWYLDADYRLECYDSDWTQHAVRLCDSLHRVKTDVVLCR